MNNKKINKVSIDEKDKRLYRIVRIVMILIVVLVLGLTTSKFTDSQTAANSQTTEEVQTSASSQDDPQTGVEETVSEQPGETEAEQIQETEAASDEEKAADNSSEEAAADDSGEEIMPAENVSVIYRFRNDDLLTQHYEKHGIEMGFASAQEYEEAASAVVNNPDSLHKTEEEDGDDVYYLEATNEFVIVSGDGYIRTYFYPNSGIDYYNRQ